MIYVIVGECRLCRLEKLLEALSKMFLTRF